MGEFCEQIQGDEGSCRWLGLVLLQVYTQGEMIQDINVGKNKSLKRYFFHRSAIKMKMIFIYWILQEAFIDRTNKTSSFNIN